MSIPSHRAALAAAQTMSILYTLCTIAFVLWPKVLLQITFWLSHMINTEKYISDFQVSGTSFIVGIVSVFAYTYIAVRLFCWLYQRGQQQ